MYATIVSRESAERTPGALTKLRTSHSRGRSCRYAGEITSIRLSEISEGEQSLCVTGEQLDLQLPKSEDRHDVELTLNLNKQEITKILSLALQHNLVDQLLLEIIRNSD